MTTPLQQLHKPLNLLKMPLSQARVEIAKDVLAAIELDVFQPKAHNTYFWASYSNYLDLEDLRTAFRDKRVLACEVCGLGALFVAKVGRLDCAPAITQFHSDYIRDQLYTFFNPNQLALIECAFEYCGYDHSVGFGISQDEMTSAILFGAAYVNDRERLKAIMENIIDNGGEFKP